MNLRFILIGTGAVSAAVSKKDGITVDESKESTYSMNMHKGMLVSHRDI